MITLVGDAAFLCLGAGIGCWLGGAILPGPVAGIVAMAAFVALALALIATEVWVKSGAGQAWPLAALAALAAIVTVAGIAGGKRRGWD